MSDEAVDPEEVRHVAALARINLDDEAVETYAEQFRDVLEHFETLDSVPSVDRDAAVTNVMRPDEIRETLDRADALANAPDVEDDHFKGPNVS